MRIFHRISLRLRSLFHKSRTEQELVEELRFHVEKLAEEYVARGMTAQEARQVALRHFGGVEQIKEQCRETWGIRFIETLIQDVRYGLRQLRRNPGFTVVAVLTLALGIGANTAIFTVFNAMLLRRLYDQDPGRLVSLSQSFRGEWGLDVSPPDVSDWKQQSHSFTWIAAFKDEDLNILGGSEPDWVSGVQVDANLFRWLGIQPLLGRVFLPEEAQAGKDRVVVLSYGLWQRRFGGDPRVLGRTVTIEPRDPHAFRYADHQARAESYFVVGVMKPYFQFPPPIYRVDFTDYDAWIPLSYIGKGANDREDHSLRVVAFLRPDVSMNQAQAEMDTITRRIAQQHDISHREMGASLVPLQEVYVHDVRPALRMILGAVCLVFLIACANVANLQLVRSGMRQREIAVRAALGAPRRRIMGQLLLESLLLAGLAGAAGLLLTNWGTNLLVGISPEGVSHFWKIEVDRRVLFFALGTSLLAAVIFGLAPAVQASRVDLSQSLKVTARTLNAGVHRDFLRKSVVISEVAISFVLLMGAGLLIRSYLRLQRIDLGFRPDHVMTLQVNLLESKYGTAEQRAAFFEQALERIETLPGVESAGGTTELPMIAAPWGGRITTEDQGAASSKDSGDSSLGAAFIMITPNYLQTMGARLKAGRYFTRSDQLAPAQVGMVSESLAHRIWPHENPLGKRLGLFIGSEKPSWIEIVGVVGDIKHFGPEKLAVEAVYLPDLRANPNSWFIYVMRGSTNLFSLARAAEGAVHAIDKDAPVVYPRPMDWWVAAMAAWRRFSTLLLGIFAALAILLAAVGIYGVISYAVTQRTHEIGIRRALGAQQINVLRLVVGQGIKLALLGLGIGLVAFLALARVFSSLLFGVTASDPATYAVVSLVFGAVAVGASYLPARRATKVDPMVALRYE